MIKLNKEDVVFANSGIDPVGIVFKYDGRIFRAIKKGSEKMVEIFINSELFSELQQESLLVKTWITSEISLDGYEMILEHEKIPFVTNPYEWSFSMLKAANETILKIAVLCKKHGYILKDGHPWNISFHYATPLLMDFGSIVPCTEKTSYESFELEYIETFYMPLKMWSKGHFYFAHRVLTDTYYYHRFLPCDKLFTFRNHFLRWEYLYFTLRSFVNMGARKLLGKKILKSYFFEYLLKRISKMKKYEKASRWMNYHSSSIDNLKLNSRFNDILEILKRHNVLSVFDIAGNQGAFSIFVSENSTIENIICSDYDSNAIDSLFLMQQERKYNVTPMLLNVFSPIPGHVSIRDIRMDAVVAMALTHHLVLTYGKPLDFILNRIGTYSKKYVLVEFMPLGLWDGINAPLPVPEWYTIEWFRENFRKLFNLIEEKQVAENRVVFFGEHKNFNS